MSVRTYTYESRDAWLADRANFVGASEVASCIAVPGAYSSRWELWARKSGKLPGVQETESMRWGSRLERSIAMGVGQDHGGVIEYPDRMVAYGPSDAPWRRATPDAIWHREQDGESRRWLLEVKNVDRMLAEHWEDGAPPHVVVQIQYQLACTGYDSAAVAALVGGNRLHVYDVHRDDELIEWLEKAVDAFWGTVQRGEEPPAEARDVELLPLRWSARQDTVADLSYLAARALVDADRARKDADAAFRSRKAAVMQAMGEATEGQIDGQPVVTWRENKSGSRVFRIHRDAESVLHPKQESEAS